MVGTSVEATARTPIPFCQSAANPDPTDTLIVSDLHLGLPDSRPRDLLEFLHSRPFGRLILLGDVFHGPSFRHVGSDGWRLLAHLRELGARQKGKVVWLHGNHDRKLGRAIAGLLGIEGRESFHWQQHGRSCVAMHGDCFDEFISRNVRFGQFCSDAYAFCQRCLAPRNKWLSHLDVWHGKFMKLGNEIAEKAARHAATRAFDVVVCGHTHEPVLRRFDSDGRPVAYANTGAWVSRPASFVSIGPNGLALDFMP